jgi:hypothetical protein
MRPNRYKTLTNRGGVDISLQNDERTAFSYQDEPGMRS